MAGAVDDTLIHVLSGAIEVTTRKGGRSWRDASPRFLYALMPELTAVTPALGPIDGGTVLRLEGKRLGEGAAHPRGAEAHRAQLLHALLVGNERRHRRAEAAEARRWIRV